jgi:hypothetical protein
MPYKIHTVLTHCEPPFHCSEEQNSSKSAAVEEHWFDLACIQAGIEHRLIAGGYPTKTAQAARWDYSATSLAATPHQFQTRDELDGYFQDFLIRFNFSRRLKRLDGKTPYQYGSMVGNCATFARTHSQ